MQALVMLLVLVGCYVLLAALVDFCHGVIGRR